MTDDRPPLDTAQRAFIISMMQRMPESLSRPLLANASIRKELLLPEEETLQLFGKRFARTALLSALRDVADGKPAILCSTNGAVKIDASWLESDGTAVLAVGNDGAKFANAGLMSSELKTRSSALTSLLQTEDMSIENEADLLASIAQGPFGDDEYIHLEALFEATPKAVYRRLFALAGEGVPFDALIPEESAFFQSLLGVRPPETLGRYRTEWLLFGASLDTVRQARWVALTAPIAVLKGSLVSPTAQTLERDTRLRLARFLADSADPFSQVAGFQLAAADHADPEFRAIGDEILPILLDRSNERTEASLSFLVSALILTGTVVARRRTLDGWPIYAKRLACHLHASLLVRTFGTGRINVEDMERIVGRPLAQNYRLVELCDARILPEGLWAPPSQERIHALMMSRIAQTVTALPEGERPPAWTKAVDEAVALKLVGPEALVNASPGPLDPFEADWSGREYISSEAFEATAARLAEKSEHQAVLTDLAGLVVALDVERERRSDLASLFSDFAAALPDNIFPVGIELSLQLAARWRLPDVAERLIDLSLRRAQTGALNDLNAGPRFSLLAAASNEDLGPWAEKAGEYLKGFAFALPPGPQISNLIAALELVGDFAPDLQPHLIPAKSFAILAHNQVPASNFPAVPKSSETQTGVSLG